MSDLGRLVETVDFQVSAAESVGQKIVSMHRKEARALLSAARELEALKEAIDSPLLKTFVRDEIKQRAAAILAEKEKNRADKK